MEVEKDLKQHTKRILAALDDARSAQSEAHIVTHFISTALHKLAIAPAQAHSSYPFLVIEKAVLQGLEAEQIFLNGLLKVVALLLGLER